MNRIVHNGSFAAFLALVGTIGLLAGASARAAEPAEPTASPSAEHLGFFSDAVLPLLQEHCFSCHADDKARGGLRLDTRARLMQGGESGAVVDLEDPDFSLLLEAVRYESFEMPPKGQLPEEAIEVIERWISLGAPYAPEMQGDAEEQLPVAPGAEITESDRQFWSFLPLEDPPPPESRRLGQWVNNPIDAFIAEGLEQAGLSPNGAAEPRELIRRLHFDLTGLPPEEALVEAFAADPSETHYQRIVDSLLATPEYGERWGRHWLDLVRYAETNSYERDDAKPEVWRYRDYVIEAFNADKPFDQFTAEQLAGDEMPYAPERLIATGYYRLGLWDDEPADPKLAMYDEMDDLVMTTSQVFLGLTINCARCHEHKIDPVTHADYYRMLGFFRGVNRYGIRSFETVERHSLRPLAPPEKAQDYTQAVQRYRRTHGRLERTIREAEAKVREDLSPVEQEEFRHRMNRDAIVAERVGRLISQEELEQYREAVEGLRQLEREKPPELARALSVTEQGSEAPKTFVLIRGNPEAEGAEVEPGFPEVLAETLPEIPPSPNPETSGRRTVLARWLTDAGANPLTPRVTANRLWQYHFGRGLVRTSNDFGFQGDRPTHPQLLDWLASRLVEHDWHFKPLHRIIVTSQAYRMSSRADEASLAADPQNDRFWRFDPRRLSAEEIRDAMLAVTGQLNLKKGGPSMYPVIEQEVLAGQSRPGAGWHSSPESERARRSIYIHIKRSLAVPLLASFDAADTDFTCAVRFTTNQPTQALAMMNSDFLGQQAALFAADVRQEAGSDAVEPRVRLALQRVMQRPPDADEVQRGVALVERLRSEHDQDADRALELFCLLALNLNEFIYLD